MVTPCPDDAPDPNSVPIQLTDEATLPVRATDDAAGFDLCASEDISLPAQSPYVRASTGIRVSIGAVHSVHGTRTVVYGMIRARSGLTAKGIEAFHGTIDADYRGEICVLLKNTTDTAFEVRKGMRIAQLIFSVALLPTLVVHTDLSEFVTARGGGGFGSTGDAELAAPRDVVIIPQSQITPVAEVSDEDDGARV